MDFPASINFIIEFLTMLNFKKKRIEIPIYFLATKKPFECLAYLFMSSPLTPSKQEQPQLCNWGLLGGVEFIQPTVWQLLLHVLNVLNPQAPHYIYYSSGSRIEDKKCNLAFQEHTAYK